MTVSQLLQEARALIAAGWLQGWLRRPRPDGGVDYCLVGALIEVYQRSHPSVNVLEAASNALRAQLPVGAAGLDTFDDDSHTTQCQVLALFDRALTEVTK